MKTAYSQRWINNRVVIVNKRCGRAFTLIELLAAMAVFCIIILLVGRIFSDTTSAWRSANVRSDQNLTARMALNFMRHELELAVVNSNVALRIQSTGLTPDKGSPTKDWINFATLSPQFGDNRDMGLVCYYVSQTNITDAGLTYAKYSIRRGIYSTLATMKNNGAYSASGAWLGTKLSGGDVLLDNISSFYITLIATNNQELTGSSTISDFNKLAYADIFVGVLGAEDIKRAGMTGMTPDMIRGMEKRYTTRVYFFNRQAALRNH